MLVAIGLGIDAEREKSPSLDCPIDIRSNNRMRFLFSFYKARLKILKVRFVAKISSYYTYYMWINSYLKPILK
jgi:hypothetical protein